MSTSLPIDGIRSAVLEAIERVPVVISAPTGTGKSTQVPRWLLGRGAVLVIEPRRVACRSLASRVAELEGCPLGGAVGYSVRDDHRAGRATRLLFATTGVVLRMMAEGALPFATVVVDEFHERSLDIDLLLALLLQGPGEGRGLVVMSATLDADAVARHVEGEQVNAQGRLFPVVHHFVADPRGEVLLPDARGLEDRVVAALDRSRTDPGDVLVFLPGKGEIAALTSRLSGRDDLDPIPLHGGLTLDEQSRAFAPAGRGRRKVVLATNVAETSITLPGVGVVIDSGLVRRTRYHNGRAYLTLVPIATDSAEQRAGRAGRTAPGVCYRLWSELARIEERTPPAMHREALAPLVLAAAACGARAEELPFLDPPRDYALDAARGDLSALDAIDGAGRITHRGRRLFGMPVDAPLGRLLVEAEARGCLSQAVDLVAVLSVGRPLFTSPRRPEDDEEDDPRACGCDVTARVRLLRGAPHRSGVVNSYVLGEARRISSRLRQAFGLPRRPDRKEKVDGALLARTAILADPRTPHVARVRKGKVAWSNGGTEATLARESAIDEEEPRSRPEAIAVLESRALETGSGKKKGKRILITCAAPLRLQWIAAAGLGQERARQPRIVAGVLTGEVEQVFARRVVDVREEVLEGALAREAVVDLFLQGRLFRQSLERSRDRLEAWALLERLRARRVDEAGLYESPAEALGLGEGVAVPTLDRWTAARVDALGLESGEDLELLGEEDFLVPDLSAGARTWLDRTYPRKVVAGDTTYAVTYDLVRGEVTLEATGPQKKRRPPPPLSYLPPFTGMRVVVRDKGSTRVLR